MPPIATADTDLERLYLKAAKRYLRSLPPEHFMEATDHAHQRFINFSSFVVLHYFRPDIECFSELLVQYPKEDDFRRIEGVVPDQMLVVHGEAIHADLSFDIPLQPVRPILVLDFPSKHNKPRKDYEDNRRRYEQDLRVPYYLHFVPGNPDFTLYRLVGKKYEAGKANEKNRFEIPEMEMEAGMHEGWVRHWYRNELLQLPAELYRDLESVRAEKLDFNREADGFIRQTNDLLRRADENAMEIVRLRKELAKFGIHGD